MTKSTITRERLEWLSQISCRDDIEDIGGDEIRELASMALAAMDSEPVAWRRFQETPNDGGYWILYDYRPNCSGVEPLYRHAQPAPVVPGKWIPLSEQMPENKPGSYEYLVFETLNNRVNHDYWNVPDEGDDTFTPFWNHYGEYVTHWMPLPTAPQEVKGE